MKRSVISDSASNEQIEDAPASTTMQHASANVLPSKRRIRFRASFIFTAIGVLLGVALLAVAVTLFLPEQRSQAAPKDAFRTHAQERFVSPRGERSIYEKKLDPRECFNDTTIAWAGGMRTGVLDRAGFRDDINRIAQNIEDLRGHKFTTPVKSKIVARNKVGKLAADRSVGSYSRKEAALDTKIFAALGIVDRQSDLRRLFRRGISQSVVGFYLPGKNKLVAGGEGGRFDPMDEIILAHELEHALADQTLGMPDLDSKDATKGDSALAQRTLIEGDAVLSMWHYAIAGLDLSEIYAVSQQVQAAAARSEANVDDSAPYVFRKASVFPYNEGFSFACHLFSYGGWGTIDAAYQNPPTSTAQIIFPGRYMRGIQPIAPPEPLDPPKGWKQVRHESLGAAELLWMFQSAGNVEPSSPAAGIDRIRGWNGGDFRVFQKKDQIAIRMSIIDGGMKTKKGKVQKICPSMRRWFNESFPSAKSLTREGYAASWGGAHNDAALSCRNGVVALAIAPRLQEATTLTSH